MRTRVMDLTGNRYGMLLVKSFAGVDKNRAAAWNCECDCGTTTTVIANSLRRGLTKSCGNHLPSKTADIEGQRFGMWTVKEFVEVDNHRMAKWKCICDCGNVGIVSTNSLRTNNSTNCGCRQATTTCLQFTKHGKYKTAEYQAWASMKQRCNNKKNPQYPNYGGRGIKVCEQWNTFETFYSDMGKRPDGLSIDRINNDGDYEPSNCRWATIIEQNNNQRRSKKTA
jgi:hypothetical protein